MRSLHIPNLLPATALLLALGVLVLTVMSAETGRGAFPFFRAAASRPGQANGEETEYPSLRPSSALPEVAHYRYKVVKTYPHNRRFFTQGLVYEDGLLYEGTGLYGQSAIYKRDLQTGKILKTLRLPEKYFGEGVTLFGDKLLQLTWQSGLGFVYQKDTFTPLHEFKYAGEGWGLTHDGTRLILSDGTSTLRFLDPNTFAETGRLQVRDQGRPVENLNELEYVAPPSSGRSDSVSKASHLRTVGETPATPTAGPQIYANVWQSDRIAIIDPQTGRVTGWIDLAGLYTPPASEQGEAVLNGIAYLPQTRHLLVTGKLWPRLYEIELLPERQ